MKKLLFREPTQEEYRKIKAALSASHSSFYGILVFGGLIFVGTSCYPILKNSGESLLSVLLMVGVILLILFLVIGRSYSSLNKRRSLVNKRKIKCADMVCIDVKHYRTHSTNYRKYIYKLRDANGRMIELKDPHCLKNKPALNDRCLVVNFNDQYYSVYR